MVKKTDRKMERTRRHIRVRRKISGTVFVLEEKYLELLKDQDYVYIEAIAIYMYK